MHGFSAHGHSLTTFSLHFLLSHSSLISPHFLSSDYMFTDQNSGTRIDDKGITKLFLILFKQIISDALVTYPPRVKVYLNTYLIPTRQEESCISATVLHNNI